MTGKRGLFKQIADALRAEREKAAQARSAAQEEANRHVGRMESRYDTFKEEAQYEVAAQEMRIEKYEEGIRQIVNLLASPALLESSAKAQVGSLIALRTETGDEKRFVIAPAGGGIVIRDDGDPLTVLTLDAPLGQRLLGLSIGDQCEISNTRYTITSIS